MKTSETKQKRTKGGDQRALERELLSPKYRQRKFEDRTDKRKTKHRRSWEDEL